MSIDEPTLKIMLKSNPEVKGPAIANVVSQMTLKALRDLPSAARGNPVVQARVNDIKNSKDLTAFETQYLLQIQPQAQGEKVAQGIEHMTSKQVLMLPDAARENPLLQAHLDKLGLMPKRKKSLQA